MAWLAWLLCSLAQGQLALATSTPDVPFGKALRDKFFQFKPGFLNFNHGGFGATPLPVRRAMDHFTDQQEAQPTAWFGGGYKKVLQDVRPRLAEMMNANISDLVFLDDASAGLNAVLRSLPWQPGDLLLLTTAAYAVLPNTGRWLQQRYGIRTVRVNVSFPASGPNAFVEPLARTLRDLGEQTAQLRLAVFDHVSSYPPAILPVAPLAKMVKAAAPRAAVLLDGAHALGQVPVDMAQLAAAGVDAYVTDGHKWLMAPKGSGALWASKFLQDVLEPAIISSDNGPDTSFQDRFDYIGTRDYTPWCAMGAALDFRQALGGEALVQSYMMELSRRAGRMMAHSFDTETVVSEDMTPAMFAVRLPLPKTWDSQKQQACTGHIAAGLIQDSMQIIPFTLRTEDSQETHWIRVSAQVYLELDDFKRLAAAVLRLRASCDIEVAGAALEIAV
ncbi:unnamed protein product [Effrenium voratum]|uniref:Aminotransferase class V domain-containing protein n=1 Tax=Effrenium voratum TaxID=2562239 RepID=A0AA36NC43_9DINO|nr:unnamed protein product [Effrenium voratum]CAJ1460823.1 unnamed protein product [Effrenium voratum]